MSIQIDQESGEFLRGLTAQRAVEFAIEIERLGAVFYEKLAEKFKQDGEVSSIFRTLAEDEVTHEIHFARDVSDRVILMADGVWAEMGHPDEFFTNPKEERTRQFLAHIL